MAPSAEVDKGLLAEAVKWAGAGDFVEVGAAQGLLIFRGGTSALAQEARIDCACPDIPSRYVSGKLLAQLVATLRNGIVTVSAGPRLSLTTGAVTVDLALGEEPAGHPHARGVSLTLTRPLAAVLDAEDMHRALTLVGAVSGNDLGVTGTYWKADGQDCWLEATDLYSAGAVTLAPQWRTLSGEHAPMPEAVLGIPKAAVAAMVKLCAPDDWRSPFVEVVIDSHEARGLTLSRDLLSLSTVLRDTQGAEVRRLLRERPEEYACAVAPSALLSTLLRARIVAEVVAMRFTGEGLTVRADEKDSLAKATEVVECDYSGPLHSVTLGIDRLLPMLRVLKREPAIALHVTQAHPHLRLTCPTVPQWHAVLAPVREPERAQTAA